MIVVQNTGVHSIQTQAGIALLAWRISLGWKQGPGDFLSFHFEIHKSESYDFSIIISIKNLDSLNLDHKTILAA